MSDASKPTPQEPDQEQKPSRLLRKLVSFFILALIVAVGAYYYSQHRQEFHVITTISVGSILLLLLPKASAMLLYPWQLKVLGDHYGLEIRYGECFAILRLTSLTDLLLPLGAGGPVKAVYLKKVHRLRYSAFVAASGVANLIKLMVFATAGVILLVALRQRGTLVLLGLGSGLLIITSMFFTLAHRLQFRQLARIRYIGMIIEEWRQIRSNATTIRQLLLISLMIYLAASCSLYLSFRSFSVDVGLLTCGVIAAFTSIIRLVRLAPGNLGVVEAVIISVSALHGVGVNESVHAAALSRVLGTLATLVIGPPFAFRLMRKRDRSGV